MHSPQIDDLLHNFGGQNWIDCEVHGVLVATSQIVHTDTLRYMKVYHILNSLHKLKQIFARN